MGDARCNEREDHRVHKQIKYSAAHREDNSHKEIGINNNSVNIFNLRVSLLLLSEGYLSICSKCSGKKITENRFEVHNLLTFYETFSFDCC